MWPWTREHVVATVAGGVMAKDVAVAAGAPQSGCGIGQLRYGRYVESVNPGLHGKRLGQLGFIMKPVRSKPFRNGPLPRHTLLALRHGKPVRHSPARDEQRNHR